MMNLSVVFVEHSKEQISGNLQAHADMDVWIGISNVTLAMLKLGLLEFYAIF